MFPTKAHSPTVFDSKRAKVGGDAACCQRAMEGLPLFTVMPLVTSPMNGIAQSILCSTRLIEKHYPALVEQLDAQGRSLPTHVHREFEAYLKCGRLEHGFLRVRCATCRLERLVAFSCKKRGFCPSCGARRMAETAALLSDEVFPDAPLRQWVISFPFPLRYLFAAHPQAMGKVLRIVYRTIATHLIHKAGYLLKDGATGAVTLIQRFGSALNVNIHFHILFLDGVLRVSRRSSAPLSTR